MVETLHDDLMDPTLYQYKRTDMKNLAGDIYVQTYSVASHHIPLVQKAKKMHAPWRHDHNHSTQAT